MDRSNPIHNPIVLGLGTWKILLSFHLQAAKRVLRFLKGRTYYGVFYKNGEDEELTTYTDIDYAGDLEDRRSTSGYVFKMCSGTTSWSSRK
ncbi:hypothetical protein L3X38_041956 [Prunus dulcis]|uniref:Uncharacterized protein n=1 Tax=Prunus dulcis TaxID=3755 RepID=A0AAD4UVX2_PRUDU|nr:hypothetical protein L3X38_041956 [Prunus dulcis]